ncbi:hypothetical protein HNQ56_003757 [Anaerotaenia torta]|uniref:hypothetical protein n=1 Tax=Anaerotaenia torta TaxID=433293 RepID=UPI003D1ECDE4
MKCKNKCISINGAVQTGPMIREANITAIISNDETGKTLTLGHGDTALTIPFEAVEKWLI